MGDIIVACGSYQQITKESFGELLDSIADDTDIISPWRQRRVDPFFNQLQSRIFNYLARKIIGTDLHDLSCTVKIFRREVLEETKLYGNMYRFLPIVAAQKGFISKEIKCEHYKEKGKTGFYKISEYIERIIDILTLYFNVRFIKKPLRFFSAIGSVFLVIGLFIICLVFTQRIFYDHAIGDRPILLLAIVFMVLGAQSASFGLLGEIIAFTHGRKQKGYAIKKII